LATNYNNLQPKLRGFGLVKKVVTFSSTSPASRLTNYLIIADERKEDRQPGRHGQRYFLDSVRLDEMIRAHKGDFFKVTQKKRNPITINSQVNRVP
jgi:hypothetical protein